MTLQGSDRSIDSNTNPSPVTLATNSSTDETDDFGFTTVSQLNLTCPSAGASTGEVGVFFSSPAMIVTGGVSPYTFSVIGTLPAGLTLDTSSGAISGTPTASGTFTIQVKDANHVVAATTCPFTIYPALALTCPASGASTGEVGVAFNSPAMTVTGGVSPYTFSVVGTLPAGLTLNTSNGAISGTPTASGTFTIQVKDASGVVAGTSCPFTINPALALTCPASGASTGEVGVAFSSPAMTVTGGVSPYTFSVIGTLPAGLTLNTSNGAISGTPTASGTFTIQVKDANGVVAATTCPFTIYPALSLTCPASGASTGEIGVAFNSPAMTVTTAVSAPTRSRLSARCQWIDSETLPMALSAARRAASGTFTIQVPDVKGVVPPVVRSRFIRPSLTMPSAAEPDFVCHPTIL